jgi:hypothetical protein
VTHAESEKVTRAESEKMTMTPQETPLNPEAVTAPDETTAEMTAKHREIQAAL